MNSIEVSVLQINNFWEDAEQNRLKIEHFISNLPTSTDILVLPEMFNTGFTMDSKNHAEKFESSSTKDWMLSWAKAKNIHICGSLAMQLDEKYYNRFLWVTPNGNVACYDKKHLFRLAGEDKNYLEGTDRLIVEVNGFRIFPIICYDLRFPTWCRNRGHYDVMICVANWPAVRRDHWIALLKARAIENQSYVVGANIIGLDGNNIKYSGDSMIVDPAGTIMENGSSYEGVITHLLKADVLDGFREEYPFLKDADEYEAK